MNNSGNFYHSTSFHQIPRPSTREGYLSFVTLDIRVDMSSQRQDEARNYDITFVTSQRGMKLPVIDGYVFVCKDKARKRFTCRTRSCRTTLTLKQDENGVYTDETLVHAHPPHETIIASLKHKHEMRETAMNHWTSLATTRSIATRVQKKTWPCGGSARTSWHSLFSPRKDA